MGRFAAVLVALLAACTGSGLPVLDATTIVDVQAGCLGGGRTKPYGADGLEVLSTAEDTRRFLAQFDDAPGVCEDVLGTLDVLRSQDLDTHLLLVVLLLTPPNAQMDVTLLRRGRDVSVVAEFSFRGENQLAVETTHLSVLRVERDSIPDGADFLRSVER